MDVVSQRTALDLSPKRTRLRQSLRVSPQPLAAAMRTRAAAAEEAAAGLWRRDPAVWSRDAAVQAKIKQRLGWLTSPALMVDALDRLRTFADGIKRDGFSDVVLLGMGGSSLAPEVLRAIVGVAPGCPRFHMLDSTDPAAVRSVSTTPSQTLYILASKSGTTIEPNSLAAHFRSVLESAEISRWADHFVAITDPDTELAARAGRERFRETFLNPPDIGGRYSALSFFGLVPAALMGQDLAALLGWGLAMLAESQEHAGPPDQNPAVALGLFMAVAAREGRDKLTLLLPPHLDAFGLWVEQLVAESTGKHGVGVVPIAGEPAAPLASYGEDRAFVLVTMLGPPPQRPNGPAAADFEAASLPAVSIDWPEPAALGAEFMRWEIATAVAGALLDINPFDEPNVQQAKDATRVLLDDYKKSGELRLPRPDRTLEGGILVRASAAAKEGLHFAPGDYAAVLAFLGPDPDIATALQRFRVSVRDRTGAATMLGYGPRYLHSTGQLHKGGPDTGVYVVITAAPAADLPIPGEPFSFGTLELAQGVGDFSSLDAAGRRALHVHLPVTDVRLLRVALDNVLASLRRR